MIQFAMISGIGDRLINEDDCQIYLKETEEGQAAYLLAVADGLGGHGRGDEASKLAVEMAGSIFRQEKGSGEELLPLIFESANRALFQRQKEERCQEAMKTTLNLVMIEEDRATIAHIGDSRTYVFREGKFLRRTRDHSVPQALVASGELRERKIRHHPDRNRVLRVLGVKDPRGSRYEVEETLQMQSGDALLVCTDGFWEWILERQMEKTLKKSRGDVREWLERMNRLVQKKGSGHHMDNHSAIAAIYQ